MVSAVVDVTQEIRIRDDDVEVGMIKKERRQGVYPAFLEAFCKAYELHREFLSPELRLYGQLLYENQLGTHALRHWFTVQLVLRGEDIGSIQYWRGDSSPESSFLYLQNKGDLTRELKASNDRLVIMLVSGWGDFDDGSV